MDEFRYTLSRQLHKQSPMEILSPDQVSELVPILNMDNIHGGLFTPNEGHIDPYSLTMAIAKDSSWFQLIFKFQSLRLSSEVVILNDRCLQSFINKLFYLSFNFTNLNIIHK